MAARETGRGGLQGFYSSGFSKLPWLLSLAKDEQSWGTESARLWVSPRGTLSGSFLTTRLNKAQLFLSGWSPSTKTPWITAEGLLYWFPVSYTNLFKTRFVYAIRRIPGFNFPCSRSAESKFPPLPFPCLCHSSHPESPSLFFLSVPPMCRLETFTM